MQLGFFDSFGEVSNCLMFFGLIVVILTVHWKVLGFSNIYFRGSLYLEYMGVWVSYNGILKIIHLFIYCVNMYVDFIALYYSVFAFAAVFPCIALYVNWTFASVYMDCICTCICIQCFHVFC